MKESIRLDLSSSGFKDITVDPPGWSKNIETKGKIKLDNVILGEKFGRRYYRGLNVGIIDGKTGEEKEFASFDTFADPTASNNFINFVNNNLRHDDIIAITVLDEAVSKLTSNAKEKLRNLGSVEINNLGVRCPWIFVGKNGTCLVERRGQADTTVTINESITINFPANVISNRIAKESEEQRQKQLQQNSKDLEIEKEKTRQREVELALEKEKTRQLELQMRLLELQNNNNNNTSNNDNQNQTKLLNQYSLFTGTTKTNLSLENDEDLDKAIALSLQEEEKRSKLTQNKIS